jgi:hypothetical protein
MTLTRRITADLRANPMAHGALLLVPAIQYGLNYFVSCAAVLFMALAWHTRMRVLPFPSAVVAMAVSFSLLWSALYLPDAPILLREARLAVGLVLLFWMLAGAPRHDLEAFNGNWALILLTALAIFAVAQAVGGKAGIALYMPKRLFVNSTDNVLADGWVQQAREHGFAFKIRPSAAFSEPSYMGVVSLFLNFICIHTLKGRKQIAASLIAIAACGICQTFYGMIANMLVTGAYHHRRIDKTLVISVCVMALALMALPIFAAEPSRIEKILTGDDVSAGLRITQPFELIGYVLEHEPFGIPLTAANHYFEQRGLIQPFEDAPFHNGSLSFLFAYGWLGFIILTMMLIAAGSPINALFMVLLMSQNGAPMDFDKLFMVTFAIQIARHAQARQKAQAGQDLATLPTTRLVAAQNVSG